MSGSSQSSATPLTSVRQMFELNGRNYVVTGGFEGIGFAVVRAICEMGGNVAVIDIAQKPTEAFNGFAKEFGVSTSYHQADVSDESSLRSAFASAVQALGTVHGVLTAAGIAIDKAFTEQTWAEAEKIQKVNVLGSFFTAQMAAAEMQKHGHQGSIVLIASITAHVGLPGYRMSAYNASKGGIKMLTNALATELGPKGIRVNSISPGFIETSQTRVAREANPEAAGLMYTIPPLKRIGTPNDIVGAAIYLLSDASAYTTGADILITGGIHAGRSTDYEAYS